jgi:hypothetical protein
MVERDDALRRAHEDLAGACSVAAEWEPEVASAHAQLQQDRTTLERAWAWQSQAEERAKEAEGMRTTLADKAAALASAEEQLRQEQPAGGDLALARACYPRRGPGCARAGVLGAGRGAGSAPAGAYRARRGAGGPQAAGG